MESKPVNKRVANYLRQKLVAHSGAMSAVAQIAADMSDEEVIAAYEHHNALDAAKLARKA